MGHFQREPLQMVLSQPWPSWLVASLKCLLASSFFQQAFSFPALILPFWCFSVFYPYRDKIFACSKKACLW
jgi:hypothetical protein